MTKLRIPLVSLKAVGRLGNVLTFRRSGRVTILERKPEPPDAQSLSQLSWRHMFQKVVVLWHALSPAEKLQWESDARPHHMTGYAWFVSQALRPNPGIYLPLQGGTMTGELKMGNQLLSGLIDPVAAQEAATKNYVDDMPSPFWTLIADTVLSAPAASVSFSSISSGYPFFFLIWDNVYGDSTIARFLNLTYNSDSGANYDWVTRAFNAAPTTSKAQPYIQLEHFGDTDGEETHNSGHLLISNRASQQKIAIGRLVRVVVLNTIYCYHVEGKWRNTADEISTITLTPSAGNFVAGSRFTLLGGV